MNILELNFEKSWRGGERQTIYNIRGFIEKGHQVSLICKKNSPLQKAALEGGFSTFAFNNIFQVIGFLIKSGKNFRIIHAQTSHILTYCLLTKPFHRAKIIFSRRVVFKPAGFFTRLKYRWTDKIVAISRPVQETVSAFSGRKDIAVVSDVAIPKLLNSARAEAYLKEKQLPDKKYIIGTLAALGPDKDPVTLIAAIKKLKEIRNDFIFLHFGNGHLSGEIREEIKASGLDDVYFLMGFVEEAEDFFSLFDVFVMSSAEEGLGSSVLDAFLYKVPVVATDAGGLMELLEDGRGIRCPKRNPEALAEGIREMLSMRVEQRKDMALKACEYVSHYHTLDFITAEYLKVFEEALKPANKD